MKLNEEPVSISARLRKSAQTQEQNPVDENNHASEEQMGTQSLPSVDREITASALLDLIDRQVHDEAAYIALAHTFDGQGTYEELLQVASYITRLNPGSAEGLAYKARALQKLERYSAATIANDQALLLDTNLPLAWINRSGLQLLQQKFQDALRSTQRAVELAPDDTRAWANRGVALLNAERLIEALDAFNQALRCDPRSLLALQMKGEILQKLGRIRDVIPVARQALTINPADVVALTQAINALRALEQHEALIEIAQELIKQTPESLFAWDNYIRGLRGMGSFAAANDALDQALELNPSNIRFLTFKADTLYRLEHYREAANVAQRALKLDPDYQPANRIHEKSIKLMYQRKKL